MPSPLGSLWLLIWPMRLREFTNNNDSYSESDLPEIIINNLTFCPFWKNCNNKCTQWYIGMCWICRSDPWLLFADTLNYSICWMNLNYFMTLFSEWIIKQKDFIFCKQLDSAGLKHFRVWHPLSVCWYFQYFKLCLINLKLFITWF